MAVREVLQIGHPTLLGQTDEVPEHAIRSTEIQEYVDDLIDTMRATNGSGIAANQIGVPLRIFAVEVNNNPRYPYKPPIPLEVIINPRIEFLSERTFDNFEGCLSVPDLRGVVTRHLELRIRGFDRDGNAVDKELRGYSAGTYQHEADHLDGLLFPHRVQDANTFCSWKVFREFHEQAFSERVAALVREFGA